MDKECNKLKVYAYLHTLFSFLTWIYCQFIAYRSIHHTWFILWQVISPSVLDKTVRILGFSVCNYWSFPRTLQSDVMNDSANDKLSFTILIFQSNCMLSFTGHSKAPCNINREELDRIWEVLFLTLYAWPNCIAQNCSSCNRSFHHSMRYNVVNTETIARC